MTKKNRPENDIIQHPKPQKSKGPMTLGWSTFIDEIIRKAESQPSVRPRIVDSGHPIVSLQATSWPSVAYAEVNSKTEGTAQSFQDIENLRPIPSQEGNSCNIHGGGGETRESKEPRSPQVVIDQRTPSIPDQGSVVKIIPTLSGHLRDNSPAPEIPEGYWHIFDQMANNPQAPIPLHYNIPLLTQLSTYPWKLSLCKIFPPFMDSHQRIQMHFCLNLMYYVGVMIIPLIPKN